MAHHKVIAMEIFKNKSSFFFPDIINSSSRQKGKSQKDYRLFFRDRSQDSKWGSPNPCYKNTEERRTGYSNYFEEWESSSSVVLYSI